LSVTVRAASSRATDRARLLEADPELGEGIAAEELEYATRLLVVDVMRLEPGPWQPHTHRADGTDGFALLVLRGAITREVHLADRRSAELVGPGDVLRPSSTGDSLLPHEVTLTVTEPAIVAILDERFRQVARRWPTLAAALDERLLAQAERLIVRVAIAQLGRVDQRLLALFWHLADRWGRVTPHGITVPLKLTHEALGRLVGAQRPTVSLALADLAAAGYVTHTAGVGWLLDDASRAGLEPPIAVAPPQPLAPAALAG
jgi:CRP/FNR family transcriptional regulator, cyclic AMP receptor protein